MVLFICNCEGDIKVPKALKLGEGVSLHEHPKLCSKDGVKAVQKVLKDGEPLVIAGCTPRIVERFFGELSPEVVNIREQAAFVGHGDEKMRDLIRGAVEKAKVSQGVSEKSYEIKSKSALVIGGGVAGLETARQIADSGYQVHLAEKEPFLGGMVAKLDRLYPEGTPNSHTLYPLINAVATKENVSVYTSASMEETTGNIGNYKVTIKQTEDAVTGCTLCKKCEDVCPVTVDDDGVERKAIYYVPTYPDRYAIDFEHCNKCGECVKVCPGQINLEPKTEDLGLDVGSIVLATGLNPFDASKIKEYGYRRYDGVLTVLEFERKIASGGIKPKTVAIVLCAGSRDDNYLPYCSRACCLIGLKEAKLVKDRFPDSTVYLTYIDMRSYGNLEYFYTTLRDSYGVHFIKGKPSEVFPRGDRLILRTEDGLTGEMLDIETDYVVLSTGYVPDEENLRKLRVPIEGDFPDNYTDSSLSVDSNPRGIWVAGSASFPGGVKETLVNSRDVAFSVTSLLGKDSVVSRNPVAVINSDICSAIHCRLCVATCPYGAISEVEEKIEVDENLCMGCGICSATCPAGASQLESYRDEELLAQVRGTVREGSVVAFLCKWSAYNAADKAGYERLSYPEEVRIIRVPCTGRVDPQLTAETFRLGAKGVLLGGCYPDACHYRTGNFRARTRLSLSQLTLGQFGIPSDRVRIEWIGTDESQKLMGILGEMCR